MARSQYQGRGKPGSAWYSPEGGLYFSLILKPRKNPNDLAKLTIAAAEAIASVLTAKYGVKAEIKPPNDILIAGKKICGILTEKMGGSLIVGIGINIAQVEFPEGLSAVPLAAVSPRKTEPESLLEDIIPALRERYLKFLSGEV